VCAVTLRNLVIYFISGVCITLAVSLVTKTYAKEILSTFGDPEELNVEVE